MKPKRKRRGNSRYYVVFVLFLILLGATGTGVYMLLTNVSWFNITTISHSGNSIVPDSLITGILSEYQGTNLLKIRSSQIRSHFADFARIKKVNISKSFPKTLKVTFNEREGFLWLRTVEGELVAIDSDGIVLESFTGIISEDLPVVGTFLSVAQLKAGQNPHKPYLTRIINFHKRISDEAPEFLPHISEYYMISDEIHIVDAHYGTNIIPAQKNLADQFRRYLFVQDNGNIARRSTVDLRYDKQVVVKEGRL